MVVGVWRGGSKEVWALDVVHVKRNGQVYGFIDFLKKCPKCLTCHPHPRPSSQDALIRDLRAALAAGCFCCSQPPLQKNWGWGRKGERQKEGSREGERYRQTQAHRERKREGEGRE